MKNIEILIDDKNVKLFFIIRNALTWPRGFNAKISSLRNSSLSNDMSLLGIPFHSPFSASAIVTFQQGTDPEPHHRNMRWLDMAQVWTIPRSGNTPVYDRGYLSIVAYLFLQSNACISFFGLMLQIMWLLADEWCLKMYPIGFESECFYCSCVYARTVFSL